MQAEPATTSSTRREVTVIVNPVASIVLTVLLTIVVKLLIERPSLYPTDRWRLTIATILFAGIGAGLFWVKRHFQIWYGVSEVFLGVIGIWTIFEKLQKTPESPDPPSVVALIASAYLIVRGLTNCEEATTRYSERSPLDNNPDHWLLRLVQGSPAVLSVLCKIKPSLCRNHKVSQ